MMRFLFILFVLTLSISCTEKTEESQPLIEIYQLNKRIVSHEGKAVEFTDEMTRMDPQFTNAYTGILRETTDGKWTPNGSFHINQGDLKESPLITNDEIKGFDFTNDLLLLNDEACKYFGLDKRIKDDHQDVQLVLTIDKKPILNFYLQSTFSRWKIGNAYFVLECDL